MPFNADLPRDFPYHWVLHGAERVMDALSRAFTKLNAISSDQAHRLRAEAVYLRSRFGSWPRVADPTGLCQRLDEFRAEYEQAVSLAEQPAAAPPPPSAPTARQAEQPPVAFRPLTGYKAVFDCPNEGESKPVWKDNAENRRLLRQMHEELPGPIIFGNTGERPKVTRTALLDWKAQLRERFERVTEERTQKAMDKKHSVADAHPHARDGVVMPGVGGSVRKRRTPRRGEKSSEEVG